MSKEILLRFGLEVKKARQEEGLTQKELAEKSGLNYAAISRIENGGHNVSLLIQEKIATALNRVIVDKFLINKKYFKIDNMNQSEKYLTEVYLSNQRTIDDPDFTSHVHNWGNYIPNELINDWQTLPYTIKAAIYLMGESRADAEQWD